MHKGRDRGNEQETGAGCKAVYATTSTAVSQLPYTGAKIAEWLFHQEKATLEDAGKGT
jgi:hypothetical protein